MGVEARFIIELIMVAYGTSVICFAESDDELIVLSSFSFSFSFSTSSSNSHPGAVCISWIKQSVQVTPVLCCSHSSSYPVASSVLDLIADLKRAVFLSSIFCWILSYQQFVFNFLAAHLIHLVHY